MPTLRFQTRMMAGSGLGAQNPLPDLRGQRINGVHLEIGPEIPEADRPGLMADDMRSCLPYRIQDGYDRSDGPRPFRVAVLENEHLRATFLLDFGGRLWSLVGKSDGRELLYQPTVFRLANVALRNAWCCGGVEWNIAVRGHTAHTCAPLFAARVRGDDGSDVLRLYEWDRFRGLPFQIDFLLPDGERMLLARPRVINPHAHAVRVYWWSNVAVPEVQGHRVVVPAQSAHHHGYEGRMELVSIPMRDGVDTSYPTRIRTAHDYFYSIPAGNRPWIASLDAGGRGLAHASSARLKGRKLFVWGMSPGGRRWQEHLGGDGTGYVEIQAGLGRTQSEYLAMPAGATWEWLEAYLPMEADGKIVHGDDWPAAHACVQERLDSLVPQARLESLLAETSPLADRPPEEIVVRGSGWGALENRRRQADGQPPMSPPSMPLDEGSLGAEQAPWLSLLAEGALPHRPPRQEPGAWLVEAPWRRRLAQSVQTPRGDHWLAWLHLGVMAFAAGDAPAAKDAWEKSVAREPSAWAYRNLAVLARQQDRLDEAVDLYLRAADVAADLPEVQVECGRVLIEAGRLANMDAWLAALPESVRRLGRVELVAAWAALQRDDLETAQAVLDRIELPDVREGEISLTDLWFALQEKRIAKAEGVPIDEALKDRVRRTCPPPKRIDYRMSS